MMCDHEVGPTGDVVVLWGSAESSTTAIGSMCHDILRQHVAAQRGGCGDDDASGDRDPTATATAGGAIGRHKQIQQGGGSDGGVRHTHRRDKHSDRDRCQPDIDWDVEEPCPRSKAHKLQHLVLLWFPCRCSHPRMLLVHPMLALCPKGLGPGFVCLLG